MALAGADLLENAGLFEETRKEFNQRRDGETYVSHLAGGGAGDVPVKKEMWADGPLGQMRMEAQI